MVVVMIKQLRHDLRRKINRYPEIYFPVVRWRNYKNQSSVLLSKHTEIVIEGYPRSGNTFAVAAFLFAQERKLHIARHLHAPAQIIAAIRRNVPAIVLIRQPLDAVSSIVIRNPQVSLSTALQDYLAFYEPLLPLRQHYVLATFDDVTHRFGDVIQRVNQLYLTSFKLFEHNFVNVEKVFAMVEVMDKENTGQMNVSEDKVARPSEERKKIKEHLKANFNRLELRPLLQRSEYLYKRFQEGIDAI